MSRTVTRVSLRRRLGAWFALAGTVALAVTLAVILFNHGVSIVIGIVGLVLAVAGGWWLVTEPMPRRAVGIAGLVAGLALMVAALANVFNDADRIALRAVLVAALLAITLVCACAAMVRDLHLLDVRVRAGGPPRHPVLLCNPWSGGGKVEKFGLVSLAGDLGVETVMLDRGLDLEQLARDAVARGADCLGMAGGDGSQALVASIAVEHELPFVCVSAGHATTSPLILGSTATTPANRCTPSATRRNARSTTPPRTIGSS